MLFDLVPVKEMGQPSNPWSPVIRCSDDQRREMEGMNTEMSHREPAPSDGDKKRSYRIIRHFDGSRSAREVLIGLVTAHVREV